MHDLKNPDNGFSDALPGGLRDAFPREEIAISTVPREDAKSVMRKALTVDEFIARVTTHRIARMKNGSAWSPFTFDSDRRLGKNAHHTDVIVLDIDNGTALRRILFAIGLADYAAVVVSSFSHMITTTTKPFRKVDWDKWRAANPDASEEEFARSRDKKFVEAVWKDSFVEKGDDGEPVVNGDGYIIVHHGACPKFRIIIPLRERLYLRDLGSERERAALWAALCDMLAGKLRLHSDQDAKLLTQLFFDPRRPAEFPEGGEPVVEYLDGKPFDAEAALAKARETGDSRGRENARHGAPLARQFAVTEPIFTDPRYDRVEVVRSAFKAIGNKDIGRTQWIKIAAAIYVEFCGSADGEELFEWWTSLREDGGVDPENDAASWVRFRADRPGGSSGKTIRRLAYMAGWRPEEAGFPDYQWGDGQVGSNIVFEDEREVQDIVEEMNSEFAVIKNKGKVRILHTCKDENGLDTFDLLVQQDFHLLTMDRGVVRTMNAKGKPQSTPIANYWLRSSARRKYDGLVFHPGEEARRKDSSGGQPSFYNIWREWGVEPKESGSCRRFKRHLRDHVCNGDTGLYEWLLDWMAHIFQFPMEKPGVAVVLRGEKGAGKSIVGKTIGALLGKRHYFVVSHQKQLLGNFNAHLAHAMLIQAEEAFFVHDPTAWGVLKDLITRETRTVEPKGVDAFMLEAFDRLIITGNAQAIVPAEPGERRYVVFDVDGARAKDTAFFGDLESELVDGGYERLLCELMRRDLRRFDCRTAPETEALAEQKRHNLPFVAQWALDRLQDGGLWTIETSGERRFDFDRRDGRRLDSDDEPPLRATIGKDTVRNDYLAYCRDVNHRTHLGEAEFGKWLVENLGFVPAQRRCRVERRAVDGAITKRKGQVERCYRLPTLEGARERFLKNFELLASIFDEMESETE